MRRIYATFDGAHMGSNLELSNAAQIVTFTGSPTTNHRMVRSTLPLSVDAGNVEFLLYGNEALEEEKAYVGLVLADSAVDRKYVGEDSSGFGYRYDNGAIYSNGSIIDTFDSSEKDDIVEIIYDPAGIMTVRKNGAILGSVTLPLDGSDPFDWYFAATVSGTTAGGLLIFCNAGQQDFAQSNLDGWWIPQETIAPLLLSTEPFLSLRDDSIPNLRYDARYGCIEQGESFSTQRSASFWPDGGGGSSTSGGVASLRISDPDDTYSALLTSDVRDLPVVFRSVPKGGSLDDALQVGQAVIDRVEAEGDFFKVIYFIGPMAVLESRLQGRLFLPNTQEQVAGRPWPVLIGGPRNFSPPLYDDTNNLYAASHVPLQGVGALRVQGFPIVSGTDYVITPDILGFQLLASGSPPTLPDGKPLGKFTAEASTAGGGYDPGNPDYLNGIGEWLSDSISPPIPDGWDEVGSSGGLYDPFRYTSHELRIPGDYLTRSYVRATVVSDSSGDHPIIKAGRSYSYKITVISIPGIDMGGVFGDGKCTLALTYMNPVLTGVLPFSLSWAHFQAAGVYTGTFTNTTGVDQPLYLAYDNNNRTGTTTRVGDLFMQELPDVATNVALTGVSLEAYCREMIEALGKLQPSVWRSTDAALIDAVTGYELSFWAALDAMTIRQGLSPGLDSFASAMVPFRDGSLGICRAVNPDDTADIDLAFDIGKTTAHDDFESQISVSHDVARGLTTQMLIRRNYSPYSPSDYGDYDTTDIPITVRKKLEAQYQQIVYSGVQLAGMYRHALTAPPLPTLFDRADHAQAEIDRVCGLYIVPRRFFTCDVNMPPSSTLEVGQIGRLTYPVHGLADGKKVQIRSITEFPADERATITFWG